MTAPSFTINFDYRCPFARNANEHVIAALAGGADYEVSFKAFSLSQVHVADGSPLSGRPRRSGQRSLLSPLASLYAIGSASIFRRHTSPSSPFATTMAMIYATRRSCEMPSPVSASTRTWSLRRSPQAGPLRWCNASTKSRLHSTLSLACPPLASTLQRCLCVSWIVPKATRNTRETPSIRYLISLPIRHG